MKKFIDITIKPVLIIGGTPSPRLTERELGVLRLIESGASNKEIADQLSLSIHTVKFHIGNLYVKLGVRTRTQAIRTAGANGLLKS